MNGLLDIGRGGLSPRWGLARCRTKPTADAVGYSLSALRAWCPEGAPASSPGLRGTSYPGSVMIEFRQPQRGCGGDSVRKGRNPFGDLCKSCLLGNGARVCDPQRLDLQGDVLRLTEPRSIFEEISFGVGRKSHHTTQGSRFAPTLGWRPQSRWDWAGAEPGQSFEPVAVFHG